jgi:DNA end-binding protein Ku
MRSMSNTNITFGLISVPVKMYSAIELNDLRFNQFHVHDDGSASRIEMPAVCKDCGEVVSRSDLVKGVERGDTAILVSDDELKSVESDSGGEDFEVLSFVGQDEIDPISYESPYYLEPDPKRGKRAVETYSLLRTVLTESNRVGIVRYTMRGKTHLAVLRAVGNALVVQNIQWPADVRAAEFPVLDGEVTIDPKELKLARQLVDMMSGEFDPSGYVDTYGVAVNDLIDAKESGRPVTVREETEAAADVSDLLAALEASVAAHPAGKDTASKRRSKKNVA